MGLEKWYIVCGSTHGTGPNAADLQVCMAASVLYEDDISFRT